MGVDRRTVLRAALVATATAIVGEQVAGCDIHPHKSSAAATTKAAPPSDTPTTRTPTAAAESATATPSGPPAGSESPSALESAAPTSADATSASPASSPLPAFAHEIVHGPATATGVALTFHGAGDPALAIQLLAALKAANAQVTVLAVGTWLETHPDMAMRILDDGHELGNHTYDHLTMPGLAAATDDTEITRCADLLQRLTGSTGRWFRPSGTSRATPTILAAAARAGYRESLSFDVDPLDYTDPGPDAIVTRLLRSVRQGSIVSMHFGHPGTVQAMPRILDGLQRRQLRRRFDVEADGVVRFPRTRVPAGLAAACAVTVVVGLIVSSCTEEERDELQTHRHRPAAAAPAASTPTRTPTLSASASPLASSPPAVSATSAVMSPTAAVSSAVPSAGPTVAGVGDPLPGMPSVDDPTNVYSHDAAGLLNPVVSQMPDRIYVPNSESNTVDEIDPATGAIVNHFAVPAQPQHVVPSYDLKTLWVNSDIGNALVPIDPMTGQPGKPVTVADPYNLYFTPDGQYAIVMAERLHRIDWLNPQTMAQISSTIVPCTGVNHADFSLNGRYFIVSCEFDGKVLKVDTVTHQVVGQMQLTPTAMPQDVKMAPDGKVFYIADMQSNGVWEIDGDTFTKIGFIPTGKGAHGLYVSRDAKVMYVTNRGEGSIGLIDLASRTLMKTFKIPGGGSPDMGGLSVDGTQLWVSGRYSGVVYEISTIDGRLIKKIRVGSGPHGLCVYPQPGRYSLGHTGVFR